MKKYSVKRFVVLFYAFVLLLPAAMLAAAEAPDDGYIVKKGDTLWNISSDKLKDPFSWPVIWKANPGIKDPHWIYPGQKLLMPPEGAAAALTEKEETEKHDGSAKSNKASDINSKKSKVVKSRIEKLPVVKTTCIVPEKIFMEGGYITSVIPGDGRIVSSPVGGTIMGTGDAVYVALKDLAADNETFYILGGPEELRRPGSDMTIGYVLTVKGVLRIAGKENGNIKGVIERSSIEVKLGDLLVRYAPVDPPFTPSEERRPRLSGAIIKIREDRRMAGSTQIVYLDLGSSSGVRAGDLFEVATERNPHVPVGTIRIISTSESASAAVVTNTVMEVTLGDLAGN